MWSLYFWIRDRKKKTFWNEMCHTFPQFHFISSWVRLRFVNVCSKYLGSTFSKNLLAICMLWFCAAFRWRHVSNSCTNIFAKWKMHHQHWWFWSIHLDNPPRCPRWEFPYSIDTLFQSLTLKSSGEKESRSVRALWMDTYQKIFACADFSVSFFWRRKGISHNNLSNWPT